MKRLFLAIWGYTLLSLSFGSLQCSHCYFQIIVWPESEVVTADRTEHRKLLARTAAQHRNVYCTLEFAYAKLWRLCQM